MQFQVLVAPKANENKVSFFHLDNFSKLQKTVNEPLLLGSTL